MSTLASITESWSSIYSNSWALRSCINFAHIGGLVGAGGCAIAADRATLIAYDGDLRQRNRHMETFRGVHRVVVTGLALVTLSGVLLMLADLDAYLHARVFWIKMAGVVALTLNGFVIVRAGHRAEGGDDRSWRTLRRASMASLALWFATTLFGAVLPNVL
ncbi:MAG TPA: hypothetical protein VGF24_24295 [Vicinamibacterales bacterium]|jgi:hypothetical protein